MPSCFNLSQRETIHIANKVKRDMDEVYKRVEEDMKKLNEISRQKAWQKIKEEKLMDDIIDQTPEIVGKPIWDFASTWKFGKIREQIATTDGTKAYVERLHVGPFIRRTFFRGEL